MIVEVFEEELKGIVDFSWEIFCDKNKYGFPKFNTYKQMYERFLRAIKHKDDKVLVCYDAKEIIGVLTLCVIKEDNYIHAEGGALASRDFDLVMGEFLDYLRDNYNGYEMYFMYPLDNYDAIKYLEKSDAKLMDSSLTMNLSKDDFRCSGSFDEVVELDSCYYDEYIKFHNKNNPNMYWSGEKIIDNLHMWKVYVVAKDEYIVGSIFVVVNDKKIEIYGVSIDDRYKGNGYEIKLISKAMNDILKENDGEVLYFVDEDDESMIDATLELGFRQIDTYRSYKFSF